MSNSVTARRRRRRMEAARRAQARTRKLISLAIKRTANGQAVALCTDGWVEPGAHDLGLGLAAEHVVAGHRQLDHFAAIGLRCAGGLVRVFEAVTRRVVRGHDRGGGDLDPRAAVLRDPHLYPAPHRRAFIGPSAGDALGAPLAVEGADLGLGRAAHDRGRGDCGRRELIRPS